jgi:tRNA dimethylallyltransferase
VEHPVKGFLVGPTGCGKTEVGILVAKRIGAEILNVDSRQIYRRLDCGTAKPTAEQRKRVRHHLLDLLEPEERCSAGHFAELFRAEVDRLRERGMGGLAVGGAGLYVDACLGRIHRLPKADDVLRRNLMEIEARDGEGSLHRRLARVDPETAARLAPRDLQRILRALEVVESTGKTMAEHFSGDPEPVCPPSTPLVYLRRERKDLYTRIELRCRQMVKDGLPEEVRALVASGVGADAPGMRTLGYREWIRWALGECDRAEAMELFLRNSRRYAKRQETWFRNRHPERIELEIGREEDPRATAEKVLGSFAH